METQAQLFAAKASARMAKDVLFTMKVVRWVATLLTLAAMYVSYAHQAHYLGGLGMPGEGAWTIPGIIDGLTFVCVRVLGTTAIVKSGRVAAGAVLAFPVSVSGTINFIAPGANVTKWAYVAAVLAIPAAEIVASRIRPDFAAMDAMERKLQPPVEQSITVTVPDTVEDLVKEASEEDVAPVSPAPGRKPGRPSIPARKGPAGKYVHAETGEPLKVKTEYRRRKEAEVAE